MNSSANASTATAPAASPKAATGKAAPTKTTASTAAAKPAAKKASAPQAKAPVKAAPKAAPKATKSAQASKPAKVAIPAPKADKPRKLKLVRDSLSIPKDEYEVIALLKLRAGKLGHAAKKTEILRAGLKAVAVLPDAAFLAALQAVPSIKTGRPAKHKAK
jgi:hypothetical protein